jgi:antitoxin component of MazEF toxin-antitoxin module
MNLESTVGLARPGTKSLRATIPEGIVAFLELNEGDRLDWRMEVQNDERVVIVKRLKALEEQATEIAAKYAKKSRRK